LTLAEKDENQVYWSQPFCVTGNGTKQWSAATVCDLVWPPAERRAANLVVRHAKSSRPVELVSRASYRIVDADDVIHMLTFDFKTNLSETTRSVNNQGVADVTLHYDKLEMRGLVNGRPLPRIKDLEKFMWDAKFMRASQHVDPWGNIIDTKTDVSNVRQVSQNWLNQMGNQVQVSMSTLAVPLPNKQAQPLHEWETVRELPIGDTSQLQTGMLKMKYTYIGSRRRAGREEAVLAATGEIVPLGKQVEGERTKAAFKPKGVARGIAIVDVATGHVIMARLVADIDTELTIRLGEGKPALTGRAGGRLEVSLRRGGNVSP